VALNFGGVLERQPGFETSSRGGSTFENDGSQRKSVRRGHPLRSASVRRGAARSYSERRREEISFGRAPRFDLFGTAPSGTLRSMILSWMRRRRRRKILSRPFPAAWSGVINENVPLSQTLDDGERRQLERITQILVAEKNWEGCQGLEMSDEIRVTIAAQAAFLVLGFHEFYFDRLLTVLVYPDEYLAPETIHGPGGLQIETSSVRLGEAWHGGPVILSWPDVLDGAQIPDDGENVVLHEFAHVLDMHDAGTPDGVPPLESGEQYRTWNEVMTREYERLARRAERGRPTLLNHYGALNEAEFFAVATECFFELPRDLLVEHPRLYEVLQVFYRQDPAARLSKGH